MGAFSYTVSQALQGGIGTTPLRPSNVLSIDPGPHPRLCQQSHQREAASGEALADMVSFVYGAGCDA